MILAQKTQITVKIEAAKLEAESIQNCSLKKYCLLYHELYLTQSSENN